MTGEPDLVAALARTLETLRRHQGPHGEIPSNVAPDGSVSYGTLAGRADAPLWYVIGCAALGTVDPGALTRHGEAMRRALWLCGAWEFNGRGLIYVPMGGSWADEYILHGYVLHVQLLYLWALRAGGRALADDRLSARAGALAECLRENFWAAAPAPAPGQPYHPAAHQRLRADGAPPYWLAAFHPGGYEPVFDGFANGLALLMGLGHAAEVAAAVERVAAGTGSVLTPAFYPAITPADPGWAWLERHALCGFRNRPWEYHNGGLWPVVTGFMAAGLVQAGQPALACRLRDAIAAANAAGGWGFYEFHHGRDHTPMGVRETAWSAAATVLAEAAVREGRLPPLV